jgi:hypothetical protein
MPNVTLSMDEKLLEASRRYASAHRTTLNGLIRKLLVKTVAPASENKLDGFFRKADEAGYSSKGKKWTRDELYRV